MDTRDMLPVYFDTEFTGLRQDTTLLSIGLVVDDDSSFYAEFTDYDQKQVDDWLRENVIKHFIRSQKDLDIRAGDLEIDEINYHYHVKTIGSMEHVRACLLFWLNELYMRKRKTIQFYGDNCGYDWVLLHNLLYGTHVIDGLHYLCNFPIDLSTYMQYKGMDPDQSRIEFLDTSITNRIACKTTLAKFGNDLTHNALFDAYVTKECFKKLNNM